MLSPDEEFRSVIFRYCPKCESNKPQTEEYFYIQRPRGPHKSVGWQSYCKQCWTKVNAENKLRRKIDGAKKK